MSYRVYISDHAARDLHAIYEHIAFHLQAPLNARKQLSRLEDAIYSLDIFPERHPRYTKGAWRDGNLHVLPVDNYVLFYFIDSEEETVTTFRIIYGGRQIEDHL